jgi:hypothetical protein
VEEHTEMEVVAEPTVQKTQLLQVRRSAGSGDSASPELLTTSWQPPTRVRFL